MSHFGPRQGASPIGNLDPNEDGSDPPNPDEEDSDPPVNKWVIKPPFYDFLNAATEAFFNALTVSFFVVLETALFTLTEILLLITFGEKDPILKDNLEHVFLYSKLLTGLLLSVLLISRLVRGYDKFLR
jgi:hypothetical protein